MNSKILSLLSTVAIALVASAPLSQAVVYSPSQFNTALKAAVGTKKGAAAYNAAAKFYQKALGDKKNAKNAAKYATSITKVLTTKVVPIPLQGKSTNTLVRALLNGYFKSVKPFDLTNATYNKALNVFLKKLNPSQKTAAVSQSIYDTIKTYAIKKGATAAQVYSYYTGVSGAANIPPPPVS